MTTPPWPFRRSRAGRRHQRQGHARQRDAPVDVPEDAIETTGRDCFLKIELQTTLIIGQNNVCWQHTLYAKVYVLFQCQACWQGHYKSSSWPEECQACGTTSYSKQVHGSTECILCGALSYVPQGNFASSNCTCNAGLVGLPCSECGQGFYKQPSNRLCTECPGCPIGKYRHDCIHESTGVCLECALGFFKPSSAISIGSLPSSSNFLTSTRSVCLPCLGRSPNSINFPSLLQYFSFCAKLPFIFSICAVGNNSFQPPNRIGAFAYANA